MKSARVSVTIHALGAPMGCSETFARRPCHERSNSDSYREAHQAGKLDCADVQGLLQRERVPAVAVFAGRAALLGMAIYADGMGQAASFSADYGVLQEPGRSRRRLQRPFRLRARVCGRTAPDRG